MAGRSQSAAKPAAAGPARKKTAARRPAAPQAEAVAAEAMDPEAALAAALAAVAAEPAAAEPVVAELVVAEADAAEPIASDVDEAAVGGAAQVRLSEVLDLNAAGPLAAELLALRGRDIEVDASAVQRMGAQCLQVLLSARATWNADGTTFALVAPSDEFASTLALLGAPIDQHFSPVELSA